MGTYVNDIRYGIRRLTRSPGFTAVVVLSLAVGIGANTAVFTVINALLLRSLPVKDPQQLVLVTAMYPSYGRNTSFSYPLYEHWCDNSRSFSGLLVAEGIKRYGMTVESAGSDSAERVRAQAVSGNFFDVLGVSAVLGRTLSPVDDREGGQQAVAVISHSFWRQRFALDPNVLGKTIVLEGSPLTVAGVAPRGFSGVIVGSYPDLWWPIQASPLIEGTRRARLLKSEDSQWLTIMGRLKPGIPAQRARAELDVRFRQIIEARAAQFRPDMETTELEQFRNQRIELEPGGTGCSNIGRLFKRPLVILMAAVGLVLLVASANLAGLLLARGMARRQEFSVRAALGAGRLALMRQIATENLLLVILGGVSGLVLAQQGVQMLAHFIPGHGDTVLLDLAPDMRILAFTLAISTSVGVLLVLIPTWRGGHLDLVTTLKNGADSPDRRPAQFWKKLLVMSQIAVSCCLLIGAGLFLQTVRKLKAMDIGLNRENLLAFHLDLGKGYDFKQRADFCLEVLRRVESLPGVQAACCSNIESLGGSESAWGPDRVVPRGLDPGAVEGLHVRGTAVTPGYFETMGIPLLRGRDFDPQDEPPPRADRASSSPRKVIIDQTSARKLFGNEDPVGRFLWAGEHRPPLQVIGVAKDVVHKNLRSGPRISIYGLVEPDRRSVLRFFNVRTIENPLAMADTIRRVVRELDSTVEVTGLQTMNDVINDQLFRERSLSSLVAFFSVLALVLACLGLYGTLSYNVARRTREIGVRMALGAQARNVQFVVIRQGMTLTLIGCVLGALLAVALTRVASSLLYGVAATDPLTFLATVLLLVAVALPACWLPARRAATIDPMVALRYE